MTTIVSRILLEVIIGILIFVAMFGWVNATAEPSLFFMRFYAKDLGTTVDTMHAARGQVDLTYYPFSRTHLYTYNFTGKEVFVTNQDPEKVQELQWVVRQQWGTVGAQARPALAVTPKLLEKPSTVRIVKGVKTIVFDEDLSEACGDAANATLSTETRLVLAGSGASVPAILAQLRADAFVGGLERASGQAKNVITFTLRQGGDAKVSADGGVNAQRSSQLACLVRLGIDAAYPNTPFQQSQAGSVIGVALTLPAKLTPEDETAVARGLLAALTAFVEVPNG